MDSPNPFWTEEERIEMAELLSNYKLSRREELIRSGLSSQQIKHLFQIRDANHQLLTNCIPQAYSGQVIYFSAVEKIRLEDEMLVQKERCRFDPGQPNGWNSFDFKWNWNS